MIWKWQKFLFCWLHIFHILLVAYLSYFSCEVKPTCSTIPLWGFTGGSVQRNGSKKLLSTSPKEYSDLKICEWCKHISFRTKWQQNSWWVTMSTLILAPSGFNFLENDYSCEFRNKVLFKKTKSSLKRTHQKTFTEMAKIGNLLC